MRLCVFYVYWMLLFTSVVSSALLFLIVASENIQNSKFIGPDRNQGFAQEENVTDIENSPDQFESNNHQAKPDINLPSTLKPKIKEETFPDAQSPISSSFDIPKNEEVKIPEEIEILKESLTQQPNLSQGISDGGQPVVLTLVDGSLHSLADFRSKSAAAGEGNASATGADEAEELARIAKLLAAGNGAANDTGDEDETYGAPDDDEEEEREVVVVRAEQKRQDDDAQADSDEQLSREHELDELTSDEVLTESPTTAPELNDSAARARLTGSADESSAAILDGFVTVGPSDPHEDMPSFNEWAQKRLEEAEKKKSHPNASVQTASGSPGRSVGSMRMRSKNYASPDCGAKIVAANPESRSARNVLVATRDEYMLNTCTSRVWFVVELCEAIQAKKIELANFELFSSSPKDLSVFVSDRFPTRDWQLVGQFTARDERDVQSFSLQPQLFGKFIKVELHSHYGSEHFCPISLFRAYGTSEFEVLETETETDAHSDGQREGSAGGHIAAGSDIENEDEDDEESVFEVEGESTSEPPSSHIFGSARDAVLSIVKKAAEVLVKSQDLTATNNITKIQESIRGDVLEDETLDDCTTPLYNVACRDCNDDRFARVFQLISCKEHYLEMLLDTPFVQETLSKSHLCSSSSGLDFLYNSEACADENKALEVKKSETSRYYLQAQFLSSLFTPDYIIALCNVLAAREQRLFVNASHQQQQQQSADGEPNKTRTEQTKQVPLTKHERVTATRASEAPTSDSFKAKVEAPVIKSKLDAATDTPTLIENLVTQIKPTKTIAPEAKKTYTTNLETSKGHLEDGNVEQVESLTPEVPASIASKRPSTLSQKSTTAQEQVQVSANSHEVSNAGATIKVVQNSDATQKTAEKAGSTGSTGSGEFEAKIAEEKMPDAKSKVETVNQDPKIATQDQLAFDAFDFKDIDVDSLQNSGAKNDASATSSTTSTTPQQKESVFLRLSNRIKVLERNMSLSSQYLEELSRRYKKQVEEMQRSLERAVTAMNEESRKGQERESKRLEEVTALRDQIETLTKVLDEFVYENNSWRINFSSLIQHGLFVMIDVIIVILILSYCKRADDDLDFVEEDEEIQNEKIAAVKPKRGKTYEIAKQTCSQLTKKPKKRRPSEIASQVTGNYDQLMIEDHDRAGMSQLSKKDRRKKRKKESVILRSSSIKETSNSSSRQDAMRESIGLPSRSASASDALFTLNQQNDETLELQRQGRPESAPDNSITYFVDQRPQQGVQYDNKVQILAVNKSFNESNNVEKLTSDSNDLNTSLSIEDDVFEQEEKGISNSRIKTKLSSPSFMKTALGSRSKRISFSVGGSKNKAQSLDESTTKPLEMRYDAKMDSLSELETNNGAGDECNNGRASNGHVEESDDSRSSSATPTVGWSKKEKKSNGLKKMVRKFF